MQLELGTVLNGKVNGITSFGAFIDLPDNKKGMVHISEISKDYVENVSDYLKEGQDVKVKILSVNDKGEIRLSIRKACDNKNNFSNKEKSKFTNSSKNEKKPGQKRSFEDMMMMFKAASEEKMSDLKRATDSKRSGYSRRSSRKANI